MIIDQSLFLGQDLDRVARQPESVLAALYESAAFKHWKEARDHQYKTAGALFNRLDGIAKQINGLGKLLAGR